MSEVKTYSLYELQGYTSVYGKTDFVAKDDYTALQRRLDVAIKRGDACMQAEMAWEKVMMAAIGEDGAGSVSKAIAALKAERDALAAENAYLLPKAASELSNAWVLHKYWVGIHAALMHLRVGRIYEVEQWLQNTVAGPGIEAPNLKLTEEIDAWAIEQSKDSISHSRALEIMKPETPATDAYLNAIRAEGVIMFATKQLAAGELESTISLERLVLDAEEFYEQLRAGKDGE